MMTMYKWDDPALKQIWQKLYADNSYLFPYSSWEYNEQIYKYIKVKPSSMFQKNYFLVYEEEKKPLVLFPLYLKKNKLRLFGENISGAGHLDLLYDEAITTKQFENAFSELKSMFPSKTLEYLRSGRPTLCYALEGIPEEYGQYLIYIQQSGADGIRQAVQEWLQKPAAEREARGRSGREYVLQQKNPKAQCNALLSLLRRMG